MSYRCETCGRSSRPGAARIVHTTTRQVIDRVTQKPRSEIAAETTVCGSCAAALRDGQTVDGLRQLYRPEPAAQPAEKPEREAPQARPVSL